MLHYHADLVGAPRDESPLYCLLIGGNASTIYINGGICAGNNVIMIIHALRRTISVLQLSRLATVPQRRQKQLDTSSIQ